MVCGSIVGTVAIVGDGVRDFLKFDYGTMSADVGRCGMTFEAIDYLVNSQYIDDTVWLARVTALTNHVEKSSA